MKLTTKQLDKLIKEEFETTKQRINERARPLEDKSPLANTNWSWIEKEFIPTEEYHKDPDAHDRSPADEQLDDGDINRAQWRDAKEMERKKVQQIARARGGFFDDKMRNDPGNYLIKKGLEEPPEILKQIWSEILTGPDKDIANGIKLPMDYGASGLDGGLRRIMLAIKGKRWTRSKYGELKKSWMDILIDAWAQDGHLYGVFGGRAMRDMYQGKGYLGGEWNKVSKSRRKRRQFWINFIAENGKMFKMALDQWTKQHASGMIGKAASWLGLEEQFSLSSKQLRDIIREELSEMTSRAQNVDKMMKHDYRYGVVGSVTSQPQDFGQYDYNNGVIGIIEPGQTRGSQYYPSSMRGGDLGEVIEALKAQGYRQNGMRLSASNNSQESLRQMASHMEE